MPKKSKNKPRRPVPHRRPPAPSRRPRIDLLRGVPGPPGVRIRYARPADLGPVQHLLPLAEPSLGEEGTMMLEHPGLAADLQRALRTGRRPSPTGVSAHPYDAMMTVSLLLVAVDEQDTVIGVLMALPPVRILGRFLQGGVPLPDILTAAHTVMKIKGVAVDPTARGRGIGTALINLCVQLYTELGWRALYGQFDRRTGLDAYYSRLGFTVAGRFKGIDFDHLVAFPLRVRSLGNERLFVRWLNDVPAAEPGTDQPA
jgi:GNAT superfamily N-acetyltransferase